MSAADTIVPAWLNRPAAARWSGLSLRTIDRLWKTGAFESRKVGTARLINRESFDAWIKGHPAALPEKVS